MSDPTIKKNKKVLKSFSDLTLDFPVINPSAQMNCEDKSPLPSPSAPSQDYENHSKPKIKPKVLPKPVKRTLPRFDMQLFLDYKIHGKTLLRQNQSKAALEMFTNGINLALDFIKQIRNEGSIKRQEGNLDGAMNEYDIGEKVFLKLIPVFYYRGLCRSKVKDFAGAMEDYNMVIKYKPDFKEAYIKRSLIRERLGDFDGVIEDMTKAAEIDSMDPGVYYKMAEMKIIKGNLEASIKDYRKAFMSEKRNPRFLIKRGIFLLKREKLELAIREFSKALEKIEKIVQRFKRFQTQKENPHPVMDDQTLLKKLNMPLIQNYFFRGEAYRKKCLFSEAEADYTKALEVDPNHLKSRVMRLEARDALKKWKPAIDDLTFLLEKKPNDTTLLAKRAHLYFEMGLGDQAALDYNRILEKEPFNIPLYIKRGEAKKSYGDLAGAIEDYTKVLDFKPNDSKLYYKRAHLKFLSGAKKEAMEDIRKTIQLTPFHPSKTLKQIHVLSSLKQILEILDQSIEHNLNILKDMEELLGKKIEGQLLRETCADLDLQLHTLYFERGHYKIQNGEYDSAIKDLSRTLEINPNETNAYHKRALAELLNKKHNNALKDLRIYLEHEPKDDTAYALRAKVYEEKGDRDSAVKDYNKAIKLNPNCFEHHKYFGVFLFNQEVYETALFSFQKALEKKKDDPVCLYYLAKIYCFCPEKGLRRHTEGLNCALKLNHFSSSVDNLELLASCYSMNGNYTEAVKSLEQASIINSGNDYKNLIEHYSQKKNYLEWLERQSPSASPAAETTPEAPANDIHQS